MKLYKIVLTGIRGKKENVFQIVNALTNCGSTYTYCLLDTLPSVIAHGLTKEDADFLHDLLLLMGNDVKKEEDAKSAGAPVPLDPNALVRLSGLDRTVITRSSLPGLSLIKPAAPTQPSAPTKAPTAPKPVSTTPSSETEKNNSETDRIYNAKPKFLWKLLKIPNPTPVQYLLITLGCVYGLCVAFALFIMILSPLFPSKPKHTVPTPQYPFVNIPEPPSIPTVSIKPISPNTPLEELVVIALGKDLETATQNDFDRVVSITYEPEELPAARLTYELSNGTKGYFITAYGNISVDELLNFRNLEYLDTCMLDRHTGSLTNLSKLHTIKTMADMLQDFGGTAQAQKIEHLTIYDYSTIYFELTDFPNVTDLELRDGRLPEPSVLKSLNKLYSVGLYNTTVPDFNVFYEMSHLHSLYIESQSLKSIEFLKPYYSLTSFGLEGTSVEDLSPLEGICGQLEELYLVENYKIEDYSLVENLYNLKKLALVPRAISHDNVNELALPDLSKNKYLTYLHIGNYDNCSSIKNLPTLETLILERGYDDCTPYMEYLPNLKELHYHQFSVLHEEFENIALCEKLETICFDNSFIWHDLSPVLNMPSLKELNLNRAKAGLNPDHLIPNPNVRYLDFTSTKIHYLKADDSWDYKRDDIYPIEELEPIFQNLWGLYYLYLPSYDISDLTFLSSNCIALEFLDMRNNYVTDMTPLATLPQLRCIVCTNNPIYDTSGVSDIIIK